MRSSTRSGVKYAFAGLERVPKDPDDFICVIRLPQEVDDLVEIPADDPSWNVAEGRQGNRIDVTNAEVGIHHVDTNGGLVQERLILLAAIRKARSVSRRSRDS